MQISMLTPYWLSTTGGITNYVFNLVEELKKIEKNEVIVITRDDGHEAIRIRGRKLLCLFKIPFILKKTKPDVIHCHDLEVLLLGALIYKLIINRKVKTVYTFHTQPPKLHEVLFLNVKKSEQMPWWKIKLFGIALKNCDLITCVSKSLAEELISICNLPIENYVVTPYGVKQKPVIQKQIKTFMGEYSLKGSFPIICTVGVLVHDWKVKGIELLINTFAKILPNYPNAKLLIVGDGQFRKSLELLTEQLKIQNNVIFTGNLDNPFIPLSITDIYCHLGLSEWLATAALEAMACGKPVLVTKAGEIPKIVKHGENGMLVEPNEEDVADKLLTLLNNSDLAKRIGKNARKSICNKFSWSIIAKKFINLYEKNIFAEP